MNVLGIEKKRPNPGKFCLEPLFFVFFKEKVCGRGKGNPNLK